MTTPIRAADAPFPVELEAGQRISWCACGRSENQPFCDGSHKGTGISPVRYTPEANQKAFLCGCKQTQNPPFCDGSHNKTVA
ncbi:CDGSH-type iron-binding zinc finger protein [Oleiphilus messinensis]|uniref:CDGSH-type iron-binding zinc finger protein n=1 Tax=Oleiphilus messinensis TaxID=141451 RepID=A0A1Y0I5A4_9GAMM|nr:CDGSH iron-sulfur domain-containing protein [Oleiphilus messinensis]ARU55389.1 CDGSH-type iron-binding zinc finger protein [Oleiphilus messinensis]